MPLKGKKSNNPAGRPKGVSNKITADLRVRIKNFLDENFNDVQKSFKGLDPEKKILLYEKLLKFVLPSLRDTTSTVELYGKLDESQIDQIIKDLKQKL